MEPDGKVQLQWGTASNADTTTGQTGATPTPPQKPTDSTSASVDGPPCSASAGSSSSHFPPMYQEFRQLLQDRLRRPEVQLPEFLQEPTPPSYHYTVDEDGIRPPSVAKQGYLVSYSTEQLEDAQVWPVYLTSPLSAEEQAARRNAELAEAKARITGITARLALANPALHPIIEHHRPGTGVFNYDECQGCDAGQHAEEGPAWPCSTIELILEGLSG